MDDAIAQHDILDVVVLEPVELLHQEAHCRRQLLCGAARVRAHPPLSRLHVLDAAFEGLLTGPQHERVGAAALAACF